MIYAPTQQQCDEQATQQNRDRAARETARLDRLMRRQQQHTAKSASPGSLSNRLSTAPTMPSTRR